jgi:hypothetical protein
VAHSPGGVLVSSRTRCSERHRLDLTFCWTSRQRSRLLWHCVAPASCIRQQGFLNIWDMSNDCATTRGLSTEMGSELWLPHYTCILSVALKSGRHLETRIATGRGQMLTEFKAKTASLNSPLAQRQTGAEVQTPLNAGQKLAAPKLSAGLGASPYLRGATEGDLGAGLTAPKRRGGLVAPWVRGDMGRSGCLRELKLQKSQQTPITWNTPAQQ